MIEKRQRLFVAVVEPVGVTSHNKIPIENVIILIFSFNSIYVYLQKVGCRILKVFSNICPQSSDRVVQCIGKANECMDAISDILVLIKEVPIKGSIQNYDPINFDDYLADKYGGFGGDGGNFSCHSWQSSYT